MSEAQTDFKYNLSYVLTPVKMFVTIYFVRIKGVFYRKGQKSMEQKQNFLKRKNIEFSVKRYLIDALSAMAQGLFASLLIGQIIKTLGEQTGLLFGENMISTFLFQSGATAMGLSGAAVGAAVAYGLQAPPLVVFASIITGTMGNTAGGPAGAFLAAVIGAEFGKAISKETKVDIIATPATTILTGAVAALLFGPMISAFMNGLGKIVMTATDMQPFLMGIIVAIVVGLALTAPISSAALCIMLELSGLAGGAATAGCCAQMIGFAVMTYKENGVGGLFSQGLGTSMLQVGNIVKNPWIVVPPTLAGAITGPMATCLFKMTNIPSGSGMGTCGLVGQIGTFTSMGFSVSTLVSVLVVQIIVPAILSVMFYKLLYKAGKIKDGDCKLGL